MKTLLSVQGDTFEWVPLIFSSEKATISTSVNIVTQNSVTETLSVFRAMMDDADSISMAFLGLCQH